MMSWINYNIFALLKILTGMIKFTEFTVIDKPEINDITTNGPID